MSVVSRSVVTPADGGGAHTRRPRARQHGSPVAV